MKVGVGPESEWELESDNRNCQELESDDGTSDSTALTALLLPWRFTSADLVRLILMNTCRAREEQASIMKGLRCNATALHFW